MKNNTVEIKTAPLYIERKYYYNLKKNVTQLTLDEIHQLESRCVEIIEEKIKFIDAYSISVEMLQYELAPKTISFIVRLDLINLFSNSN